MKAGRTPALLAALALLGLLGGCGGEEQDQYADQQPSTVAETEAEPADGSPSRFGEFDATRVYRRAAGGVVTVRAIFGSQPGPGGLGGSEGSGFVLSAGGEIVTNAHVVTRDGSPERRPAEEVYVEFPDRNVLEAEIVGADPFYDVALLRISPGELELEPVSLGDDEQLVAGQPVAAIGSPFGAQQSLSVGVISATDRSVRSLTEFQIEGAIQTDASINPGNSGGPLLDAAGRVIGVNQQIETRTGANDGVGYAVPVSAVVRSVDQLRENGRVAYPYIGVSSQSLYPQLAEHLGLDTDFGGLIAEVVPGSPADEAGLQGGDERIRFQAGAYNAGGDVIVSVDGEPVIRPDDLARLVGEKSPGDTVTLEILRDGERHSVELTLGERPRGSLD